MTPETLLYRQVNPNWVQNGGVSNLAFVASSTVHVTSSVFTPTKKDENKLSVYNGDEFSPRQSFEHFTKQYNSCGVLGVTVGEFEAEDLKCDADNKPFAGHVSVDYSICKSRGEMERKAKKMRDKAMNRGWLYQVGQEESVEQEMQKEDAVNDSIPVDNQAT
ncbi:hypothetical protein [Chitinophaga sp. HK235]|uniref:hypothetical protein n=1 Tax=Chitinophaga sp. HK235 TaxID=2952571 RepID=UPI001BAA40C2|nr:hypothetical protein [Chitinophaga sp. HK235]